MINRLRGEVPFTLDGQTHALVLTLGGLAALDDVLAPEGLAGLAGLAQRLAGGRLSPGDALAVLSAGMAGAGSAIPAPELGRLIPAADLGLAIVAAADLLAASFGGGAFVDRPSLPQAET